MSESEAIHPPIKESLLIHCDSNGYTSFYSFMQVALYHPEAGYYTQKKTRVGRKPETDFYTSSSLGSVFGRLVVESATTRLGLEKAKESVFVELGAEPGQNIFDAKHSPFKEHITLRLGESLQELPKHSVLFANEILDAQPFHRFRYHAGQWRELGVRIQGASIEEVLLPEPTLNARTLMERLPLDTIEGYTVDIPSGAETLIQSLIPNDWEGLLFLFDYGKSIDSLLFETPQGTARAYIRHRQSNNLLATPGKQDITCHIGWEWIENVLKNMKFQDIRVDSQEACFMKYAPQTIQQIITERPGEFTPERRTLQELIHPSHLGQKFQALSAKRTL